MWEVKKLLKMVFRTFIAQEAAPVCLALALPGERAGPVDTSGIKHTFVTELTLPAVVTPAKTGIQISSLIESI